MKKWFENQKISTKILLGNGVAILLVTILAFSIYFANQRQKVAFDKVTHINDVISCGHKLIETLLKMENSENGFLITGKGDYLVPFKANQEEFFINVENLLDLVQDSKSKVNTLQKIKLNTKNWIDEVATNEIALRRKVAQGTTDLKYIQTVLAKGKGKSILDEIRAEIILLDDLFIKYNHTEAKLLTLAITKDMVDQETGQRGFLITGKDEFLQPYISGQIALKQHLAEFIDLTNKSLNKNQVTNDLIYLKSLTNEWRKEAAEPEIELRNEVNRGYVEFSEIQKVIGKKLGKSILDKIRNVIEEMINYFNFADNRNGVTLLTAIAKDIVDQETGQRGFLITGNNEFLEPYYKGMENLDLHLMKLDSITRNIYDINRIKDQTAHLVFLTNKWRLEAAEPEIALRREINKNDISLKDVYAAMEKERGKKLTDELHFLINEFILHENELMIAGGKNLTASSRNYLILVIAGAIISTLIIIVIGLLIATTTKKTMIKLVYASESISKGDLSQKIDIYSKDEIGTLAETFRNMTNSLRSSKKKMEEQTWIKSHVNDIAGETRKAKNFNEMTSYVINNIIPLVEGVCGYFYIINLENDSKNLIIANNYGGSPENLNKQYKMNEGLIGQCAKEKKTIFVSSSPRNSIPISTAIGDTDTYFLLLLPVTFENDLLGVIEIVLFREISSVEKEMLDQLLPQIGIIMSSIRYATRTVQLLEESDRYRSNLEEKAAELEKTSKYKSEFLASMSHEIRTPLNAIVGMGELLEDTDLTKEQRGFINIFQNASSNLLNIINDILDISKIEAGQLELENIFFNLRNLVEQTIDILNIRASKKGLLLMAHIDSNTPKMINGDRSRLQQVIINIISNAIKFTEIGEIVVNVSLQSETENRITLLFKIKDTGIGIPKDKQEAIFEHFSQADKSTTRKYGGTGLGLAISKQIIEKMDGSISVQSVVDEGSIFSFTISLNKVNENETANIYEHNTNEEDGSLSGMSMLTLDDNLTNLLIVSEMLESFGVKVSEAQNSEQTYALIEKQNKIGSTFDAIIIDYHMPMVNGFEIAQTIRNSYGLTKLTIILLTSVDMCYNIAEARKAGIDECITKPVKRKELYEVLVKNIKQKVWEKNIKREAEKVKTVEKQNFDKLAKQLNILIAEDNNSNQFLIGKYLENKGIKHKIVENGKEAVESMHETNYNLIFMDINMPIMDGFEATRLIRENEKPTGKHTPIIALTAQAFKEDVNKCLEAGMDAYLPKPLKRDKLYETIEKNVTLENDVENKPKTTYDFSAAIKHVGDEETFKELTQIFLQDLPDHMANIKNAIDSKNCENLWKAAHKLKGALAIFAIEDVCKTALNLEQFGRQANLPKAANLFITFENEVDKLKKALTSFTKEDIS